MDAQLFLSIFDLAPHWVIIYALVSLIAFTVSSTLGIGAPLILIPSLMIIMPPAQAIAMLIPVIILNDVVRWGFFRKYIAWRPILLMSVTMLPCAFGAAFLIDFIPPDVIRLIIVLIIAYLLVSHYIYRYHPEITRFSQLGFWGGIAGIISGISGTAGPPVVIALRGYGLALERFAATVAVIQFSLQIVRLPGYISTGVLTTDKLPLAAVLSIGAIASVFIARWLLKRLDPSRFRILLDILLGIIALTLLIRIIL